MEISREVVEFGGFVLAHCGAIAASNDPGDLICPFVVVVEGDNRRLIDFESETQAEAMEKAWGSLDELKDTARLWALGREGLYSFSEGKVDVLAVSAWEPGMTSPITLMHRFYRTSAGDFRVLGDTEIVVEGNLVADRRHPLFVEGVLTGILAHPKGPLWSTWQTT